MDIGIGLPAAVTGVDGKTLVEWARESERYPFSALSVLDRIVFPNYEPLITLAAAAGATTRVRLITAILLVPLRTNTALLAKEAATLDNISGGRLVLGMAVGGREDDYAASKADFHRRGRIFDRHIDEMRAIWNGEGSIGPRPIRPGGPELMIGGHSDAAIRRVVRLGCGWVLGGGGADGFMHSVEPLMAAWKAAGRDGKPHLQAGVRFALGEGAKENVAAQARHYYSAMGDAFIERLTRDSATDAEAIKRAAKSFEDAGCDELVFAPSSPDLGQIELLAKALF